MRARVSPACREEGRQHASGLRLVRNPGEDPGWSLSGVLTLLCCVSARVAMACEEPGKRDAILFYETVTDGVRDAFPEKPLAGFLAG